MHPRQRTVLFVVFAVTGFSALTLQVVWQRVISLHAGVDLFSFTTVIAAFLTGLGLGSLLGGVLADRLGPRRSLLAFAASNAGIGMFASFSLWLFYDVYRAAVPNLDGTLAAFGFHFLLLIVPTTLMGLSLPLVSRGVVDRIEDAGPLVGRLYAANTLGAGVGAGISGWVLIGSLGFVGVVRLAGTLNLLAALCILTLWRTAVRATVDAPPQPQAAPEAAVAATGGRTWPWFLVYGLTGAVALGLEIVFFRLVDALMRSNSYTFGHVLCLYLLLFGTGAAVASRFVGRTRRPDRWFLGIQFAVGVLALLGPLVLVELPKLLGVYGPFESHFAIDGYNVGGYRFDSVQEIARVGFVHLFGPLLIMGAPVLAMGAAFPFVQRLVAERVDTLGRRTGLLLLANIAGNVTGTLLVGFVLIDALGTSGTLRLLASLLLLPGLAAAATAPRQRRPAFTAGVFALLLALVAAFPSNFRLWAYFHSAPEGEFALAEDRGCVNALKKVEGEDFLFINATSQNGHPFDDFHVLVGLLPALLHPDPQRAMAVGLGIGATPYGMSRDPRLGHLDVVEICGGEIDLLRVLARRGAVEVERLLSDPRVDIHVGDGRKFLLSSDDRFDVLTVDVVRPQAAFSGNLYSVEFYELLRSRLDADGVVSQWLATPRVLNSATEVFPHVLRFIVPSYAGSQFMVASQRPIAFDRSAVLERFRAMQPSSMFSAAQAASIEQFLSTVEPGEVSVVRRIDEDGLNHDLAPRDEYFLNNSPDVQIRG
ncbi:MAG TPA: fused MFS/spermidine synthase [Acidimicrobiales bacterium]|nr:fused MFS/spermidine synthase [Acidimicrobiales bacterium]